MSLQKEEIIHFTLKKKQVSRHDACNTSPLHHRTESFQNGTVAVGTGTRSPSVTVRPPANTLKCPTTPQNARGEGAEVPVPPSYPVSG